jgi:glycosyltransferase involved in cell wall biosynthesis
MNIVIINNNNPFKASGLVGYDFYRQFKERGYNVRLLANCYDKNYPPDIISLETPFIIEKNKLRRRIEKRLPFRKKISTNPDFHFHELKEMKKFYTTSRILKKAQIKPDIILILFAKDFINSRNIYELYAKTRAKILWLMYDMAPFTGGCHYAWDCTRYQKECGCCPGLYSSDEFDMSYKNLLFKKQYISKTEIEIISASEWQHRQARSSSLFAGKNIHKILLSVDHEIFKPVNKHEIRIKLGLPPDKKIIFFGSVYMGHRRKGMKYLLDSLKILKEKSAGTCLENNLMLLIAGRQIESITDLLPFPFHYMGFVDNTYGIASAYQAADIFLCPSLEDSGPSMINQSLMCGTPVVSFEMGVSLDLVINGSTGYLAKLGDCCDLAQGLINVLSLDVFTGEKYSANCRKLALQLCAPDVQMREIEKVIGFQMPE